MAFTMHSHSGQFCPGHAKDTLETVILHAIASGLKTLGLTEHIPRLSTSDLYPEELSHPSPLSPLAPRHAAYLAEAVRLRAKYPQIHIIIGFEGEWYRPEYGVFIQTLAGHPVVDYFIGSIHHVRGIPIDYDKEFYQKAVTHCGDETKLWETFYDEQLEMLETLRPRIVGHIDLIRLLAASPDMDPKERPTVWAKIVRNLEFVVSYGGWLECNTSALRKGLAEPYPGRAIAETYLGMGGKFTFSDDSHGVAQVATNYGRGLRYLESLGVKEVWTFKRDEPSVATEKGVLTDVSVSIADFRASLIGVEI